MPFGLKALLFKRLLINLLIFSFNIIKLILSTFYSIVASIFIILKSIISVFKKNLTIKIFIFIILLLRLVGAGVELYNI